MAEDWSIEELIGAGWTTADLEWESQTESVVSHAAASDMDAALRAAGEALRIAREQFQDGDPRLGTAIANYAWALVQTDEGVSVDALAREAWQHWSSSSPWIAAMTAPRVARSSLFHMRMEQRHRDVYEARWRSEWERLSQEAKTRLRDMETVSPAAALERWRRMRPAMLNDTRKLMAAAILLMTP